MRLFWFFFHTFAVAGVIVTWLKIKDAMWGSDWFTVVVCGLLFLSVALDWIKEAVTEFYK